MKPNRTALHFAAALLFAAGAAGAAVPGAPGRQSSPPPPQQRPEAGRARGTVFDRDEARVAGATVTVEAGGETRAVTTADDGTYEVELPADGVHRIKVARRGFCPARRAPFRARPGAAVTLNFTLTVCPIVNSIPAPGRPDAGETDGYRDPLKEEVFPLAPLELFVRYGGRREVGGHVEYCGATVTYDTLTLRADKVRLDLHALRLEAEGGVVVEDDGPPARASRAVVELRNGEPKIELSQ